MAKNCVCISYNGYYLVPVPMVSISKSYDTDGSGRTIGSKISIKLSGKMVAAGDPTKSRAQLYQALLEDSPCVFAGGSINNGIGISIHGADWLMEEERAFRKVFTNSNLLNNETDSPSINGNLADYPNVTYTNYQGNTNANRLYISSNGKVIFDGYAKVESYNASETGNNWTNTIDYEVELTSNEAVSLFLNDNSTYLLQSVSDNITIEPVEETNLFNTSDPVISAVFGYNHFISTAVNMQVNNLVNYPVYATRYKVSRTIEAVGKHSFNENSNFGFENDGAQLTSADGYNDVLGANTRIPRMNPKANDLGSAFKNARAYVMDRLFHYPTPFFLDGWTVVNRVRSINASETNGSFSITETSLAVDPTTHPPWADDWSAEVTTDSTMLTTVRINGTIKGFETMTPNVRFDTPLQYDAQPVAGTQNELKNLEPLVAKPGQHSNTGYLTDKYPVIQGDSSAINQNTLKVGKYQNALRGLHWLKAHLDNTGNAGLGNVYNSPIVNRARMFFWRNQSLQGEATFIHNPLKYLNHPGTIAERRASANLLPSNWNFGGQTNAIFNPIPLNVTESHRSHAGEIDYSIEFNNRPINIIPGSISETLSINDNFPSQQIAEIFVLGRRMGPVIQDLGTTTAATREVSFEIVLPRPTQIAARFIFPQYQYQAAIDVVEQLNPKYMFGVNPYAIVKSYVKSDTQNYNPLEGRISIQKSWMWQRAS